VLSTKYLPQLAEDVEALGEAFETGGWDKFTKTLDEQVGASGNLVRAFNLLEAYGRVLWVFLKDSLWPVSRDLVVIFGLFAYVILQTMLPALRFLTDHSTLLRVVMFTLITYFAIAKVRAIQLAIAETRLWGATALLAGWTRAVVIWTRHEIAVWGLARIRLIAVTYATAAYMTATRLLTAALLLMNITLETTPVGWILTALALIAVALYVLIFHFDRVKAAAKAVWEWVMDHKILTAILLGPIGIWLAAVVVAIALVITKLKDMIGWAKKAWGWVRDIWNSVPGANLAEGAVGFIAGHASGGMMGKAGLSLVGEQGPELVQLPAGATIKNRSQTRLDPEHQGMISLALTSIIEIDRREIARAYQNYTLDQAARA